MNHLRKALCTDLLYRNWRCWHKPNGTRRKLLAGFCSLSLLFLLFFVCCWEIPEFGEHSFSLFSAFPCACHYARTVKRLPMIRGSNHTKSRDSDLRFETYPEGPKMNKNQSRAAILRKIKLSIRHAMFNREWFFQAETVWSHKQGLGLKFSSEN